MINYSKRDGDAGNSLAEEGVKGSGSGCVGTDLLCDTVDQQMTVVLRNTQRTLFTKVERNASEGGH